jgi:hypothetical protein
MCSLYGSGHTHEDVDYCEWPPTLRMYLLRIDNFKLTNKSWICAFPGLRIGPSCLGVDIIIFQNYSLVENDTGSHQIML